MSEQTRYDMARLAAVGCLVASSMIAVIGSNDDLGLSRQAVAWCMVAQAGITALATVLPRIQGDGQRRSRRKERTTDG